MARSDLTLVQIVEKWPISYRINPRSDATVAETRFGIYLFVGDAIDVKGMSEASSHRTPPLNMIVHGTIPRPASASASASVAASANSSQVTDDCDG